MIVFMAPALIAFGTGVAVITAPIGYPPLFPPPPPPPPPHLLLLFLPPPLFLLLLPPPIRFLTLLVPLLPFHLSPPSCPCPRPPSHLRSSSSCCFFAFLTLLAVTSLAATSDPQLRQVACSHALADTAHRAEDARPPPPPAPGSTWVKAMQDLVDPIVLPLSAREKPAIERRERRERRANDLPEHDQLILAKLREYGKRRQHREHILLREDIFRIARHSRDRDPLLACRICRELGLAYRELGMLEGSLEAHRHALTYGIQTGLPEEVGREYHELGRVYELLREHELALKMFEMRYELAKSCRDVRGQEEACLCASLQHVALGNYEEANAKRILSEQFKSSRVAV